MSALPLPPDLALEVEPYDDEQLDTIADLVNAGVPVADVAERVDPTGIPWTVTDLGSAEWAMRRVAEVDYEAEVVERQHAEWRDRIERWHDAAMQRLRGRRAFFAHHLSSYALAERERTAGKVKSLTLPSGTVRTTEAKPRPSVVDDPTVIAWVREHLPPETVASIVKVTERPLVTELRKVVRIVEVVDAARVTFHCGDLVEWPWSDRTAYPLPGLGDGMICPACGDDALVGRIDVLESHPEVRDAEGKEVVLGVAVEPGSINVSVTPT